MTTENPLIQGNLFEESPLEEALWKKERTIAQEMYIDLILTQGKNLLVDPTFKEVYKKLTATSPGGPIALYASELFEEGKTEEEVRAALIEHMKAIQLSREEASRMWSEAVQEEVDAGSQHIIQIEEAMQKGIDEEASSN